MDHPQMRPIHVDRDGHWAWEGQPMLHDGILLYLKQHLTHDPDGSWWIAVGPARVPVVVEDTPYVVEALLEKPPRMRLDDGSEEPIGARLELEMTADHRLYAPAKNGAHRALLSRVAHHQVWGGLDEDAQGKRWLALGADRVPVNVSEV